jgi:hypothetical protein
MGNAILAHALFACNQVDIDLGKFFSSTGDAHQIKNLINTNLTAEHLIEYPNNNLQCILEVICQEWWEVLRLKMSYSKWKKTVPTPNNVSNFYVFQVDTDKKRQQLWQEFYANYRDPTWPNCDSINDVTNLPINIQQEIQQVYCEPMLELPVTNDRFVEWLSECYYDQFINTETKKFKNAKTLLLGNYIQGNYPELIDMCLQVLGWTWDAERDRIFHKRVLHTNAPYLDWMKKIKNATCLLIDNNSNLIDQKFEMWEQSVILAMACKQIQMPTNQLLWKDSGCVTDKINLYLDIFTRTIHYGKTI